MDILSVVTISIVVMLGVLTSMVEALPVIISDVAGFVFPHVVI